MKKTKEKKDSAKKKNYISPRLSIFGDVANITRATNIGSTMDGVNGSVMYMASA